MRMRLRLSALAIAACCLFTDAEAVVIDDFRQGAVVLSPVSVPGETQVQAGLSPASVLGGSRRVYAGSIEGASLKIDADAGRFDFRAVSSFGYFSLEYGEPTPLNLDLTAGGADRFRLSVLQLELGGSSFTPLSLRVQTSTGSSGHSLSQDLFALNGPGFIDVPFAAFPTADFTNVQRITLVGSRIPEGFEISLGSFSTVPEPTSLGLVILAGLAIGICRR